MSEPRRIGVTLEVRPHVYDPLLQPELFEGVLARRIIAFCIDVLVIIAPVILATIVVFIFGLLTFGLGWGLFWLLSPGTVIWALAYYATTFGGPASATVGMRIMGLTMRTWYGAPAYSVLGAVHAILFWVFISTLTPLVLVVALFNERRRLLHDILLGTVVINRAPLSQRPEQSPTGSRPGAAG